MLKTWTLIIALMAGVVLARFAEEEGVPPVQADTIILKDGTSQEAEQAWETEKFVHFILKGTKNVEIRYSRDIVDRIIREGTSGDALAHKPADDVSRPPAPVSRKESAAAATSPGGRRPAIQMPDQIFLAAVEGIGFYDPRRPEKYWAGPDSRHGDLQSALNALAVAYDRSAEWISANMGEENELASIHKRLAEQYTAEADAAAFEIVEPVSRAGEVTHRAAEAADSAAEREFEGLTFYEPRRAQKYWTGSRAHFATLDEALSALAAQYGVTAQWIAQHIGDTNSLAQIHRNIRQQLRNGLNGEKIQN